MTDETIDVRKKYLEAGMAVKDLYSIKLTNLKKGHSREGGNPVFSKTSGCRIKSGMTGKA